MWREHHAAVVASVDGLDVVWIYHLLLLALFSLILNFGRYPLCGILEVKVSPINISATAKTQAVHRIELGELPPQSTHSFQGFTNETKKLYASSQSVSSIPDAEEVSSPASNTASHELSTDYVFAWVYPDPASGMIECIESDGIEYTLII